MGRRKIVRIDEREAPEFDMEATRAHVALLGGAEAVTRLDAAAAEHGAHEPAPPSSAAGSSSS